MFFLFHFVFFFVLVLVHFNWFKCEWKFADNNIDWAAENSTSPAIGSRGAKNRPLLGVWSRCFGAVDGNVCTNCSLVGVHMVCFQWFPAARKIYVEIVKLFECPSNTKCIDNKTSHRCQSRSNKCQTNNVLSSFWMDNRIRNNFLTFLFLWIWSVFVIKWFRRSFHYPPPPPALHPIFRSFPNQWNISRFYFFRFLRFSYPYIHNSLGRITPTQKEKQNNKLHCTNSVRYAIGKAERPLLVGQGRKIGWLDILANDTHEYYYPNNTGGPSIKVSSTECKR